jgi:hypothetical protein
MTSQSRTTSANQTQPGVAEELKHDAGRLTEDVAERAKSEAESRKSQAANLGQSASSALDTAARDLRENPDVPDWMASALQQAARSIESLADRIEGRSIEQIGQDVVEFARRNPGTFLAASAALGFAASRVLRAGVDKKRHDRAGTSYDGQDAQTGYGAWPADEYVRPTSEGGYQPAFFGNEAESGGSIR